MLAHLQISILVFILLAAGFSAAAYKHFILGFPLFANAQQEVWKVEAKITFDAVGGESTVRLNIPEADTLRRITLMQSIGSDALFSLNDDEDTTFAQWTVAQADGPQSLYLRIHTFAVDEEMSMALPQGWALAGFYEGAKLQAAQSLITEFEAIKDSDERIHRILDEINLAEKSQLQLLLDGSGKRSSKVKLAVNLLKMQGIFARSVRGLALEESRSKQFVRYFVEVYIDGQWRLYDPREAAMTPWKKVLILQRGDEALLEVFGGFNSRVSFSTLKEKHAAFTTAVTAAKVQENPLVDFSIYSLPLAEQNTFKLLLLIPLGALVVVILRNLVGLATSGTFMPILIALTFLQTELLTGLLLFVLVVGLGLIMRYYLSHLDLLLVPRIASVLVFVIIIYATVGISMHKMGIDWGMKVTFFPMIILAWTIERMSILWEEDGGHEVFIQCGGSLLTASIAYMIMSQELVADTIFLYPELLLVILAIIISIGSYSGYRLSDLRRFSAMDRY
ncbi:MAG: UUP1 family membrane protein [Pseudomonadales bacterium]|nr:UUP1 family membrane protein [Pseudomonadales bacterium]